MPPVNLILMIFAGLLLMSLIGLLVGRWAMLTGLLIVLVTTPLFIYGTLSPCGMAKIELLQGLQRVLTEHPGPDTGGKANKELTKWSTHLNSFWRCTAFVVRANLNSDLAYDLVGATSKPTPHRVFDAEGGGE